MNSLVDTHCHLGATAFDSDRDEVVEQMRAAGVARALVIESELDRIGQTSGWVSGIPSLALATGCHPHDAQKWDKTLANRLAALWAGGSVVAAGEMGLDYHYDHAPRDVQRSVLDEQLSLAVDTNLPVIIHAREADDDLIPILENHPAATIVLHSFSSGPALRNAGLESGWYFSFSGMVTFKSWKDDESVRAVEDQRLLLETDSPYLAPVPHRGKRNEPSFVAEVAERVAVIRNVDGEALAETTTNNALRLFFSHK